MATVQSILRKVPDPRGRQGRQHPLNALLGLMLLSTLSGRKGMKAAFHLGRGLSRRQLRTLGFRPGHASPCHATLTETLRVLDPEAMAHAFGQLTAEVGAQADMQTSTTSPSTAKPCAAARMPTARPNMCSRPFASPWTRVWALYRRAARGGKSPMPCGSSISLT